MHYAVDQDQDVVAAAEQLMGDSWFGRHAYYMAQRHSAAANPTYLYFYERRPASNDETIGASHALELNPLFGSYSRPVARADRYEAMTNQLVRREQALQPVSSD